MRTLSNDDLVHAEQNIYRFACDVSARFRNHLPYNYWYLYENLMPLLHTVVSTLDQPCEVVAVFVSMKGHPSRLLSLAVRPENVDLTRAIASNCLETAVASNDDLKALLADVGVDLQRFVKIAQGLFGRFTLFYQPIIGFDGKALIVYEQTKPFKVNAHVTIDKRMVTTSLKRALTNKLSAVSDSPFREAA